MKINNIALTCLFSLFFLIGCNVEPELPVASFDDLEKGAFPRLLNFEGSFQMMDIENSSVSWEVEFYDEAQGDHVTEYIWEVIYKNNNAGGAISPITIATIPKSEFRIHPESGLPSISVTWTFQEILDAIGIMDISGGGQFDFYATIKRDDGKEFNATNTGYDIESSMPFNGFFRFSIPILCTSALEGKMNVVATGWCGATIGNTPNDVYEIEWINEGNGIYKLKNGDYSFGAHYACYGIVQLADPDVITLRIQDRCNKLSFIGEYKFGEKFIFNEVSVDGPDLYIDWESDESQESGRAVLTRVDGTDWPLLTF